MHNDPYLIIVVVGVLIFWLVLWLYVLIHCIRNKSLSDASRVIGILLIVFLGILGCMIYPFLPRIKTADDSPAEK